MSRGAEFWVIIGLGWTLDLVLAWMLLGYWRRVKNAKRTQWEADHPNLKWEDWKHVVR